LEDYIFKAENLKKEYLGRTVLDIEEMKIQKEKITAVIGPSGAGKSTLLHLLKHLPQAVYGLKALNWEKKL